jgi:hypothetical protein
MPKGKPAGVRCVQLTTELGCALFGDPRRPVVCGSLQAAVEMCGEVREHALVFLRALDLATTPELKAAA